MVKVADPNASSGDGRSICTASSSTPLNNLPALPKSTNGTKGTLESGMQNMRRTIRL